ncbi:nucleotidyltransferase MB21D2-like [Hydractinia symbiolongicarpus]|uniref:nucleotidyltransferase MB21D2-like n=1 Tax=Hydractinia symbiolongicarpus TaxID=13093 RepID=UPI00254DBBC4|nr:nucleotidyltransferase MB21D2-like [Hydractinia symbiolongicarpus]
MEMDDERKKHEGKMNRLVEMANAQIKKNVKNSEVQKVERVEKLGQQEREDANRKPRFDVVSGVGYTQILDAMSHYYADIEYNTLPLSDQQLEFYTTFVKEVLLPRIAEKDCRFQFKEIIQSGSFKENTVINKKTYCQNYIEHEFDFMLCMKDFNYDSVIIINSHESAFKKIALVGDDMPLWREWCEVIDNENLLMPEKIMHAFEDAVKGVMEELMAQEKGLASGCIETSRNGPAVTCEFDIARLPLEMQSPYEEDERSIIQRKAGLNVINNWSIDLVLCLPTNINLGSQFNFESTSQFWPSKMLKEIILSMPLLLVPKTHETSQETWRVSTSPAELLLAKDIKQNYPLVAQCWIIMKAVMKTHLYKPKCVTSYILKSVVFQLLDHIPPDYLTKQTSPEFVLGILDAFVIGLGQRFFPHYFNKSINLLSSTLEHKDLDALLKICMQVRLQPDYYVRTTPNCDTYFTDLL